MSIPTSCYSMWHCNNCLFPLKGERSSVLQVTGSIVALRVTQIELAFTPPAMGTINVSSRELPIYGVFWVFGYLGVLGVWRFCGFWGVWGLRLRG